MSERESATIEQEVNEYGEAMDKALDDLVVKKALDGSEGELRELLQEARVVQTTMNNVTKDIDGNLDISASQEFIDEFVQKYGLEAEQFSLAHLKELLDRVR